MRNSWGRVLIMCSLCYVACMEQPIRDASIRTGKLSILVLAGCLALASISCTSKPSNKAMTAAELKMELDKKLAVGSSASDVERYLAEAGLEHSGLIDNAELAHMGFDPDSFEMKTIIRGARKPSLVTTDIAASFVFDRNKKLTAITVNEVHTGP
jgi:hypothetical protein